MPVEVQKVDAHAEGTPPVLMGICLHTISLNRELELGAIKPELLVISCVHEPDETWDGKREWIEKFNMELLEARSGDLTNKYFDVCTDALEA